MIEKKKLKIDYDKVFEIQQKSPYFHCLEKGCKIKVKFIDTDKNSVRIRGSHCITHRKDICQCGWEWGHHDGKEHKQIIIK